MIKYLFFVVFSLLIVYALAQTQPYVDEEALLERQYVAYLRSVQRISLSTVPTTRRTIIDPHGLEIYVDQLNAPTCSFNENTTVSEMRRAVVAALPNLAWQYGFNVTEAQNIMAHADEIADIVVTALAEGDYLVEKRTRGFFDFFEDLGCGVFSAGALPGFLILRDIMYFYHTIGKPTSLLSTDQKFFVQATYGPLVSQESVKFYFNAGVVNILGSSVAGITFNRNVYLKGAQITSSATSGFFTQVKLLIHELRHVVQYKGHGYSAASFGLAYLFSYCKEGFSYTNIEHEVSARAVANNAMNQLNNLFPQFFSTWKSRNLIGALGFPTTTAVDEDNNGVIRLRFDKGVLEIKGKCFRLLPANYYTVKGAAQCAITPFKPPAALCGKFPDLPVCDPEIKEQQNAACKKAKEKWAALFNSLPAYTC